MNLNIFSSFLKKAISKLFIFYNTKLSTAFYKFAFNLSDLYSNIRINSHSFALKNDATN
jgi:hypothetical protein